MRLPEHLNSTISITEPDGGMCMIINKQKKRGNRNIHTEQIHHWGLMPEPIPQVEYCKVKSCARVRKVGRDVRDKDRRLHQPGLRDHQAESRRARCLRDPKARETGPSHTMSTAGYLRNRLS